MSLSSTLIPDRPAAAFAALRNADAVRRRCALLHRWVAGGRSAHFTLDEARLPEIAAYVAQVTREAYPDLRVPPHSRWRHFEAGGSDRWAALEPLLPNTADRARAAFDLATVSVLLDAGAGPVWRYQEHATGQTYSRSEGLAVTSFDMFRAGAFSSDPADPLRADADRLAVIADADIARGFQAGVDNPLAGLAGRATLLRRLGAALSARPDLFGSPARPGNLIGRLPALEGTVRLPALLEILLDALSPIWPSGLVVGGHNIGDAGRHPAVRAAGEADDIVPFHKLSQWLAYSLIEPLDMAGFEVVGLSQLTALPEYRNGGLLIDFGAIQPRQAIDSSTPLDVSSELVVEWRALTVILIESLLDPVRNALGLGNDFALPHLLQGGTWSAGRRIARKFRPPEGGPPLVIAADGTVF